MAFWGVSSRGGTFFPHEGLRTQQASNEQTQPLYSGCLPTREQVISCLRYVAAIAMGHLIGAWIWGRDARKVLWGHNWETFNMDIISHLCANGSVVAQSIIKRAHSHA